MQCMCKPPQKALPLLLAAPGPPAVSCAAQQPDSKLPQPHLYNNLSAMQYAAAHHTFLDRCRMLLDVAAEQQPTQEEAACLARHGFGESLLTDGGCMLCVYVAFNRVHVRWSCGSVSSRLAAYPPALRWCLGCALFIPFCRRAGAGRRAAARLAQALCGGGAGVH